jgi:hypothetical protein
VKNSLLMSKPVAPVDCALGIAVPLTREQFLDDLSNGDEKNFAHSLRAERETARATNELYWDYYYEPVARVVVRACDAVEKLGVTVKRSLSLIDFSQLLRRFSVVTLVSHWRFARLLLSDIPDPRALLNALGAGQTRQHEVMREAFANLKPELLGLDAAAVPPPVLRQQVVDVLNTIISSAHSRYKHCEGEPPTMSAHSGEYRSELLIDSQPRLTRVAFEHAFPDVVVPGRCIEFDDGMCTVAEVVSAIPVAFSGLLDLTVCNSVILGQAVKRARPDCIVAINRYPAQLHLRMMLYELVIRRLSRRARPFIDVVTEVHARPI